MKDYIIITGDLFDGFSFYGPFTEKYCMGVKDDLLSGGPIKIVKLDNSDKLDDYIAKLESQ